jgi:hypothetical protein
MMDAQELNDTPEGALLWSETFQSYLLITDNNEREVVARVVGNSLMRYHLQQRFIASKPLTGGFWMQKRVPLSASGIVCAHARPGSPERSCSGNTVLPLVPLLG